MRRHRIGHASIVLALWLVASCSSNDSAPQPDGTAPPPDGALPVTEAGVPVPDRGVPVPDSGVPVADRGAPVADAGGPVGDASPVIDTGTTDPGPVNCRRDGDCLAGLTCLKHIPGGHCSGCDGDDTKCGPDQKCFQGICVRKCTSGADCNVGMRCIGTSHCAGRGCGKGCPAMYPCEYPLCNRAKCDQGQACPFPMTCDGEWCMEP